MKITETAVVNAAVSGAQSLPDLVTKLHAIDPAMAQQITGKALLASKTPWGTLLAGVISYVATRYGFGWDETTSALIDGLIVLAASYAMRAITKSPITAFLSAPTTTPTSI